MSEENIVAGDKVPGTLNGNRPSETVVESQEGEVATSIGASEVKKTGDLETPIIPNESSGPDVVKKASELNIEEKISDTVKGIEKEEEKKGGEGNGTNNGHSNEEDKMEVDKEGSSDEGKDLEKSGTSENDGGEEEAHTGDKRKVDEQATGDKSETKDSSVDEKDEKETDSKKQKTVDGTANGTKKGPGRPKSTDKRPPKEKKVPVVGKTERKTRSQSNA